jgi:hypothetical protein
VSTGCPKGQYSAAALFVPAGVVVIARLTHPAFGQEAFVNTRTLAIIALVLVVIVILILVL